MQNTKNICWFLAVIVIMFYSQRSRRVIMEASKTWDIRGKTGVERTVFSLFRKLLYERYLIVGDEPANIREYKTFNEDTFVEMLKRLHEMNNKDYPYNPDDDEPYYMDSYIYKLYNLFGVDCKMFDYEPSSQDIYYSSINKEFDRNISISSIDNKIPYIQGLPPYILNPDVGLYEDDKHAPMILIITIESFLIPFKKNKIYDADIKRELSSLKEEITYNGTVYILDSVYLENANNRGFNHAIVGMTCKKKKFIFNGEPVNKGNFPCVLMRHNWNILQDRDFYLWDNDCELHDKPKKANENRYNFSEGKRRFIYVRKNESRDTSVSKESDVENYRQEQRETISREQREAMLLEKARLEKVKLEKARLRYEEQMKEEERRNAIARERKERRDAARLEEEIKKERLCYEEQMKAMKEEEQKKKKEEMWDEKEEMWDEKEEVEHYKEQMALIKKEDERKRVSDERKRVSDKRKLHKSTHQQRKYDIADLIEIMSKLKLDDDEKENHLPKRNEKRNRTNRSGSNSSPKVIKHPKK
jgi:hypothetical protein